MKEGSQINETVIYECRAHWGNLIVPSVVSFFFTLASIMGLFENSNDRAFYLVFLILSLMIFLIPLLKLKTNKLVITDKRIYGRTGIIRTQSLTAPISKIQTVNIDKKLFGKIFGYADITVHCITGVYVFKKQSNAEEMQNAILNTIK